jgi:hypothetical protein
MKVLLIGDVVSAPGCRYLAKVLGSFKRRNGIDLTIVNGENSAVGNGMLPQSADMLLQAGADVITSGNHVFRRREIYDYLEEHPYVLRPANYPDCRVGSGYYIYDAGPYSVCIINVLGRVYMDNIDCPFQTAKRIIEKERCRFNIVDFHAEATGEKMALGYYLDGKASLVVGTHTHVQTADEMILPNGTGYISDLGMTGPMDTILGVSPELVIERMTTGMPVRFLVPQTGRCKMEGVIAELDPATGRCVSISRVQIKE